MKSIFSSYVQHPKASLPILWLRIVGGGFMLSHGIPKLMKLFGDGPIQFADPFGIGPAATLGLTVFAEVICAIFILVGFKTKAATVPLLITMLVAALVIHGGDPFKDKEMALLYLAVYFSLFFLGSGSYSVDALLSKKEE